MERKHVSLVGPTVLIGLGIILLLNNLGYLDWTIWDALRLWPVLLIAAGAELLLGRRSIWGSLAAAVLVLVLIVGGVLIVQRLGPRGMRGEIVEISYTKDGIESLAVEVDPAVARLSVEPLRDSGNLVEGTVELWSSERLNQHFTEGAPARLVLNSDTGGSFNYAGLGQITTWSLGISPEVETELNADIGIGEVNFRLTDMAVDSVAVDFGIGQVNLAVPTTTSGDAHIDGGIGVVTVVVPRDLGVRIITDAGLVTRSLPGDYSRADNTYTSPNWSRADYRTTVTISLGIGAINVMASSGD